MKRSITFIVALFALTGLFGAFMMPSASAKPADEPAPVITDATCYSGYNGDVYPKGSDQLKGFNDSGCSKSDGGNCKTADVKKGGKNQVKITCTKPAPTGGSTGGSGDTITDDAVSGGATCTTDNCDIITNYINPLITLLSVLVGLAVTIGIILGAIQVITSAGDPQKNANGKNHIRNAVIALVAYIILYAFLQFIIPGGIL
ncbi:hypothetical protein BH09PAT3_BH09PAT3_3260 [soil metagenome]